MIFYRLNSNGSTEKCDPGEAARASNYVVKQENAGKFWISTVFLGIGMEEAKIGHAETVEKLAAEAILGNRRQFIEQIGILGAVAIIPSEVFPDQATVILEGAVPGSRYLIGKAEADGIVREIYAQGEIPEDGKVTAGVPFGKVCIRVRKAGWLPFEREKIVVNAAGGKWSSRLTSFTRDYYSTTSAPRNDDRA